MCDVCVVSHHSFFRGRLTESKMPHLTLYDLRQEESYKLAKDMLKLALGTVRAEETEAYDHAVEASKRQEASVEEEQMLEKQVKKAHEEVEEASDEIKSFDHKFLSNLDKWEMHRQVLNLDIAHRVEDYATHRLAEAHAKEEAAKQEEDKFDGELLELMNKEDDLQALLKELKHTAEEAGVTDSETSEAK